MASIELNGTHREVAGITAPLLAAIIVCVAASMMFVLTPLLVDVLRHGRIGASEHGIALIGSSDLTGMFVGAVLALFTVPSLDRRLLAWIGLIVLCLGNTVSLERPEIGMMLYGCRLTAGIGAGLAMGVAYAAFGACTHPERCFALFGMLQTAVGSAIIIWVAPLTLQLGASALYGVSLALALAALCAVSAMDTQGPHGLRAINAKAPKRRPIGMLASLTATTCFLFGVASVGLWANIESIGEASRLSHQATSNAIAMSLLGGVAGSLMVMMTGKHWGRLLPSAFIGFMNLAGISILLIPQSFLGFAIAVTSIQFGTNLGSHAFGALSEADPLGRLSICYLLSLKAGFAVGPIMASWLLNGGEYQPLVASALLLFSLVMLLVNVTMRAAARCVPLHGSNPQLPFSTQP